MDFLVREIDARVINQPTLWTKDNEEAMFFKGEQVAFLKGSQSDTAGTAIKDEIEYRDIGVTLRVRPNITPEKDVDMTVHLRISNLEQETINNQPVTSKLDTTTQVIVSDGGTIMLGGILFRNDSRIEQKIPLIGDLPLVGPLFRHYDTLERDSKLLVFITPLVIDSHSGPKTLEALDIAAREYQLAEEEVEEIRRTLDPEIFDDTDDVKPQSKIIAEPATNVVADVNSNTEKPEVVDSNSDPQTQIALETAAREYQLTEKEIRQIRRILDHAIVADANDGKLETNIQKSQNKINN